MKQFLIFQLLMVTAVPTAATSVLQLSFDEICRRAEFIFEGYVTRVETRTNGGSDTIHTHVTFAVTERLKGPEIGNELELSFLGGTVEGRTLRIQAMRVPEAGEAGIYFVESVSRMQVHPLLGWSQGHYLIKRDGDGIRRVTTPAGRPVRGVETAPDTGLRGLSGGVPRGLTVTEFGTADDALTAASFKESIRAALKPDKRRGSPD